MSETDGNVNTDAADKAEPGGSGSEQADAEAQAAQERKSLVGEIREELLPAWNSSKDKEINGVHQTYQRQLADQQTLFQDFLGNLGVDNAEGIASDFERDNKAKQFDKVQEAATQQQEAQAAWNAEVSWVSREFGLDVNGDWHANARDDRDLVSIARGLIDKRAEPTKKEVAETEIAEAAAKIDAKKADGKFQVMGGGHPTGGGSKDELDLGLNSKEYYKLARAEINNKNK